MIYLVDIYFFVISVVNFADVSSTSSLSRFNMFTVNMLNLDKLEVDDTSTLKKTFLSSLVLTFWMCLLQTLLSFRSSDQEEVSARASISLSVELVLTRLLSSNSAKISFSISLLISEAVFLFTVKNPQFIILTDIIKHYKFSHFTYTWHQTLYS